MNFLGTTSFARLTLLFALFVSNFLSPVAAQTNTADIVGTVTDVTGAVVPKATISVVNTGTGQKRTVQTNDSGEYTFSLLQVGTYSVQIESPGFKAYRVPAVTIAAGDRARVDGQLQPGEVGQVVDVVSAAPALQMDNSTTGSLVDNTQVEDLPLNGRNVINLVQVQPGVTPGLGGSYGAGNKPDDHRQTSSYSANGQTDQANNNLIDGFDNNERMIGVIGVRPSPDAIDQVKILTGLYTAEVGRSSGGVVDLLTKSGTNRFHGSVYEYFRNDVLDANNYFATGRKSELRQNQFGGSVGGPIVKNKTFFFGDYEGFRQVSGETFVSTVPTAFEEKNCSKATGCNFSDVINSYGAPGPIIPARLISSVGLAYFNLYPAPNYGGTGATANNYSYTPNQVQVSDLFDIRIDHHFSDKDSLFGRYSFNNVNTALPAPLPSVNGVSPGGGTYQFNGHAYERQQQAGLGYTHIFGPALVLELRTGYLRSIINTLPSNYGLSPATAIGFNNVNIPGLIATDGLPSFTLAGNYASLGDSAFEPEGEYDNSFQYIGDVVYTRGNHNFKIGASLIRRQAENTQSQFPRGAGFILGAFTGNVLGDLVTGQAAAIQRQVALVSPGLRSWEPSFYVQDDWHATKSLTINAGVRYDVFTPYTASNNAISNFNFATNLIVGPGLSGVNHSSPTAGVNTYYGDVSPRFGFALDLGHKTVVRGGFGMSYFPGNFSLQSFMKNAPYTSIFQCGILIAGTVPCANVPGTISATNNYAQYSGAGFGTLAGAPNGTGGNYYLGAGLPAASPNGVPLPGVDQATATNPADYYGSEILAMDVNFKPTYVEQFSLGLQKDFAGNVLGINYVGNLGRRLVGYPNLNQAPYNCPSFSTCTGGVAPTPIASLPTTVVSTGVSQGKSAYNALQINLERRVAKGLSGNANYTFAHNLSNISTNGEAAANIPNPDRFSCVGTCHVDIPGSNGKYTVGEGWQRYDYGNSEIDVRHRAAVTLSYNLPFGASSTGLRRALSKGWAVNALWYYQTGLPFTVENSTSSDPGGTYDGFTNSPSRPNVVGTIKRAHPGLNQYFNTAAFALQDPGTLGNEGKNAIYAPRITALNFSLIRNFTLSHETSLQLRAESFNLTNTPSFNPPDPTLGDSTFGVINSTVPGSPPRQLQFAAKLLF